MLKLYTILRVFACMCCMISGQQAIAQCGAGYTQSQLNWDHLDYLVTTGNYSGFVTTAQASNQNFAMGPNRVTIATSANITVDGENAAHTGDISGYTGMDAQFTPTVNGANITITFNNEVTNLRFTLYDIERTQRINFSATNALSVLQNVNLALQATTILTANNNNTTTAYITSTDVNSDNTNTGTVTVTVAGPVKQIVFTIPIIGTSASRRQFHLSDINACVTGSFPNNWRNVSQPFTGMPSYILTVRNNEFYLLDPATGNAKTLFTDPGHTNMNGMAYDPYNRILYYTYSLTGSPINTKAIYKFSVDNGNISTLVSDVTVAPLNIPTYDPGVTSGSASFYNGSLYFGVEASNSGRTSGRENTVWKIDFDASQNPIQASQVYAARVDSNISGVDRLIHDWSDIGVTNNGMLYDFDGAGAGTSNLDSMYYHFNMMTGQRTQFAPSGAGNIGPKQTAIDWQENVYNMGGLPTAQSNAQTIGGFIVPYNYNGTVNNAQNRLITLWPGGSTPIGSWGDCSEAFRPLCDFGDAPATYDPVALSPAVNEITATTLRIGANVDREWLTRGQTALANSDNFEDGVATVTIFNSTYSTYQVQVSVYNNTGANARLVGWLDYNGDGDFDAGEASAVATVATGVSAQNIDLNWTGISSSLPSGSYTYLRIRLASASLTSANATGWFNDGETEDYRVVVDNIVLPLTLLSFDAKAVNNSKVKLTWSASEDNNSLGYEIQRSRNGSDWEYVAFVSASQSGGTHQYELTDNNPYKGNSHYRLKLTESNSRSRYSEVRTVKITDLSSLITVSPNPATSKAIVTIANAVAGDIAHIRVMDAAGNQVFYQKISLTTGNNMVELPVNSSWPSSTYLVSVSTNEGIVNKKLILRR